MPLKTNLLIFILSMRVLLTHLSVYHVHLLPVEARRWHRVSWKKNHRWLLTSITVLEMGARFTGKAAIAPNH